MNALWVSVYICFLPYALSLSDLPINIVTVGLKTHPIAFLTILPYSHSHPLPYNTDLSLFFSDFINSHKFCCAPVLFSALFIK